MLDQPSLSIKQRTHLILRMSKVGFAARPKAVIAFYIGAVGEIVAFLITMYATAQIGALLARYSSGDDTSRIWFWVYVDIAAAIVIGLSFWLMSYSKRLIYFKLVTWSTNKFLGKLMEIDINDFYESEFRNRLKKANGYTWQIANLHESVLDLAYALLRFLIIAAVVSQITWWLIPVIALFLLPTLFAETAVSKVMWFVWDSKGDERHVIWRLDWLMHQPKQQLEIRATQVKDYLLQKINKMNRIFYSEQEFKYKKASKGLVSSKVLEVGGVAIGTVILIRQFLSGSIGLDKYFFLSGALVRIGGALNTIFGTLTRMQEQLLFADNFFMVLDREPSIIDKPQATDIADDKSPRIELKNVSFRYPTQETNVFENLSLTIDSGEHVAIVGENGAGKSTLIKLLMRYYIPDSGQILINDTDINDIAIDSLYKQIATLFQNFNEYPFSIKENIHVGRAFEPISQDKIALSAKDANVDDMIKGFKYGYDTVLDSSFKKGVEPSGGQWQRVALARAFYRDANMIILDEPTSAIDARAEYDIFNNIFKHYKNKTAVIVSHRFSTVRRADRIIVIDDGKIIEQGSHKELMKMQGLYHDLFTKQAEGYKD